jgi:uncharacterized membrane protein
MEKMLVIVFPDEKKAYEASRALAELDREGSIAIYAEAVVQKYSNGQVTTKQAEDTFPIRSVAGTAIGSLIGLLGGPIGVAVGAMAGATTGMVTDLYVAGVDEDFLADTSAALAPGTFAVIADVSEEWVTPVDSKMEALGGIVFRTPRQHFEEERRAMVVAELRQEVDSLKAEHAKVRDERKAKIQSRIDALNRKLEAKVEQAQQRSQQLKTEADAKVQKLQKKAATAQEQAKAAIKNRISEIQNDHDQAVRTLQAATAKHLRETAAKLEHV